MFGERLANFAAMFYQTLYKVANIVLVMLTYQGVQFHS